MLKNEEEYLPLFEKIIDIIEKSTLDLSKTQFKAESETKSLIDALKQHLTMNNEN